MHVVFNAGGTSFSRSIYEGMKVALRELICKVFLLKMRHN